MADHFPIVSVRGLAVYFQALRAEDQSAMTLDVKPKETDDQPVTPRPEGSYLLPLPKTAQRYVRCAGLRIVPSAWS